MDSDTDRRLALCEGAEHLGEHGVRGRAGEADRELLAARRPGRPHDTLCLLQEAAAVEKECLSGRGEGDSPARPFEQGHAELLFEPADLVTKRGLGDMEPGGGSAEVELLGDGDEVPQQAEIEPGQIACIDRRNLLIR